MRFEEYAAARGPALLRFAYVLTSDAHAAQDLTQSALADAFRHWRKVSRADHPDAYVRRILVNTHLGTRRRRWTGERPDEAALARELDRLGSPDHADAFADRDEAQRFLASLPPRARAVLVLRYYADLDDAAIADLLGVTPVAVRSTASRALATLRRRLTIPTAGVTDAAEETR
jgi:RNA polymerase sigma-70 factor (sigma-E family)